MTIISPFRFAVGLALLAAAIVLLVRGRRERGFGQKRQIAALCLAGGGAILAAGLGWLSLWGR